MMHDKQKQIMYIVGEIPKYLVMGKRSVSNIIDVK